MEKDKSCFVIMPISDAEGYERGHFRQVYEDIICPAIRGAGYTPLRADEVKETNLIHVDILQRLLDAPMAVCDLSTRNPNVLFELGIRQAFDKPVVLIQEVGTPRIFDVSILRCLEYSKEMRFRDVLFAQKELQKQIEATASPSSDESVNSIVRLLSIKKPATVPVLDGSERANVSFDVLNSQMIDMRNMLEVVVRNQGRLIQDDDEQAAAYMRLETLTRRVQEMVRRGEITEDEAHIRYSELARRTELAISSTLDMSWRRKYQALLEKIWMSPCTNKGIKKDRVVQPD